MAMNLEEFESLLFDWESGTLDEQSVERIRATLKNDARARELFLKQRMMLAALHLEADTGVGFEDAERSLPLGDSRPTAFSPSSGSDFGRSLWIAASLLIAVGLLVGWRLWPKSMVPPTAVNSSAEPRRPSQEATSHGVALVTRLVDVTWPDREVAFEAGAPMGPGRFVITSGHAQLEFFCGATVIVEGPAELVVESATVARVIRGRLRAHVPPAARGFALIVDEDLRVVDLGTEFGLSVSPQGASVQVFDGEVELQRGADKSRFLSAGEAVARSANGELRELSDVSGDQFIGIADLESRVEQQRADRFERWQAGSHALRTHPQLIAYYGFDESGDWGRRLQCGSIPRDDNLDGAIVGATEVAGRWADKRALDFKQPADRVRVQIPGEFGSLTLACWVRIDSLDRWYNSLFLTDSYDKGEPHWQILDSGQIYFSVRPNERRQPGPSDFKALSPSFWQPSMNGRWIHLAVTFDMDQNRIIHYVNGNQLSEHVVPDSQMPKSTRIGPASIGNWALPTLPDARFAIRNLNGSIDEFVILSAALGAEEIREIYEYGKP